MSVTLHKMSIHFYPYIGDNEELTPDQTQEVFMNLVSIFPAGSGLDEQYNPGYIPLYFTYKCQYSSDNLSMAEQMLDYEQQAVNMIRDYCLKGSVSVEKYTDVDIEWD